MIWHHPSVWAKLSIKPQPPVVKKTACNLAKHNKAAVKIPDLFISGNGVSQVLGKITGKMPVPPNFTRYIQMGCVLICIQMSARIGDRI